MMSGDHTGDAQSFTALRRVGISTRHLADGTAPRLLTVVVPTYNEAQVIGDQLTALAAQSYAGEWEVVVADNGSTDATRSVVESFEDRLPSVRIVDASARRGAAHARNVGSANANGDAIAYADADDIVDVDWLTELSDGLKRHDFVAGRMDQESFSASGSTDLARFDWRQLPVNLDFLPWGFGGNLAVRTAVWREVGGWIEEFPAVNDVPFCWRVQLAGYPLAYVPEAVVRYRPHAQLTGLAQQHLRFGKHGALLYREFRRYGIRRDPLSAVLRRWTKVLVRVPYLARSDEHRRAWLRHAMHSWGRLIGSIEYGVVFL
jgi:glycosyltransferase involved in cell wall biosynthesis